MPEKDSKQTLSVITADVGGFIGHVSSHPEILDTAKERLFNAREKGVITDFHVLRCGDDIALALIHENGPASGSVSGLVWNTLNACTDAASRMKLYRHEGFPAAGDKDSAAKTDGDKGAKGPTVVEMEFTERRSEPVIVFMANKSAYGSWNLPLYKIYADPFNTAGLIMNPRMAEGFTFTVLDVKDGTEITLSTPADAYLLLSIIGITSRYVVTSVHGNRKQEITAAVAAQKLAAPGETGAFTASRDNPVLILRCQADFPAVGEALEPFSLPHLVRGWMRAAHNGPLMPVPFYEANPSRFDGPARLIGAGFQISNGRFIGPHDMFDDPSFDEARRLANRITDYMRRHGPFEPHRMPATELEQAGISALFDKVKDRITDKLSR